MNTGIIRLNPLEFHSSELDPAASILRGGGLVAFPTETVYGLGANALDEAAVAGIFRAKGRPQDNPLILHIAGISDVEKYAGIIPQAAYDLFERFWPGPLTVVLKKLPVVPDAVSAGLDTVAVRMPAHPVALALIRAAGVPVAAPSANLSGRPSPTCAGHVVEDLGGKIDLIVDGGCCGIGLESTVVSLCEDVPVLLRPGAVTPAELISVLGALKTDKAVTGRLEKDAVVRSPGMKYRHYAPKARLVVVRGGDDDAMAFIRGKAGSNTGVMCFDGEEAAYPGMIVLSYGSRHNPLSLAQNLFAVLRRFDETGCEVVYARCPDIDGMGLAVYNRIVKAAGFDIAEV